MKKTTRFFVLLLVAVWLVWASPQSFSQDQESVQERIHKLEQENKQLRDIVKDLQKRLEKLEEAPADKSKKKKEKPADDEKKSSKKNESAKQEKSKKSTPSDSKAKQEPSKDDARIIPADAGRADIEKVAKKKKGDSSWLPSRLGEEFRLGGRLQVEFFRSEHEQLLPSAITDSPGGSFHIDELAMYLDADFKNKIRFFGRFDIIGDDAALKDSYIDFEDLPLHSALRIGLHKRFFRPNRFTETYPLSGIAFWRSRVLGATWKGAYDPLYTYLTVANGPALDSRQLLEDQSAELIGDDNNEFDRNGNKEVSAGLGLKLDWDAYGKLELLGFGLVGELSDEDITFLQTQVPGYGFSFDDEKNRVGINLEYEWERWNLFAQAMSGKDGALERFGWYAELSYLFTFEGMKYLNNIRPLMRYGVLDTNQTPQPFSRFGSLSWDRQQWLFAVISELVRNVHFRAEYALNEEQTGGPDVNNNEFLFQLEIRF